VCFRQIASLVVMIIVLFMQGGSLEVKGDSSKISLNVAWKSLHS
jgi:hypothetical protein